MTTNFRGINLSHILTDDEWDRLKVSAIEQHTSLQRLIGTIVRSWLRSPVSTEDDCGSCGADLAPSTTYPWHLPDEDCRAIRQPIGRTAA